MSSNVLSIGPVSNNPESKLSFAFGSNVSADKVIGFVKHSTKVRQECGLISNQEAAEMVKETENKLKLLNK